jgi:hypothetical protein
MLARLLGRRPHVRPAQGAALDWANRRPFGATRVGVFLLAGLLLAGCGRSGPQRYEVSGSVNFAGEKIAEGAIAFTPIGDTKGPKVGGNIQQGQYRIDRSGGPVAGRHRVEITAMGKTGRKVPNMVGQMIDQVVNILPPKYSDETSELTVEIQPHGKNVCNFDLKLQ